MMKDLFEVFDPRLALPIGGKTYYVPEPDAELGLYVAALIAAGMEIDSGGKPSGEMPALQLDDQQEHAFYRRLLGPVLDELFAAGHGMSTVRMVAQTAFFWIGMGRETAEAYWESGGDPKASAPASNRAGRRAAESTATGAASTTRKRASMSTTTSRKTSSAASANPPSRGK